LLQVGGCGGLVGSTGEVGVGVDETGSRPGGKVLMAWMGADVEVASGVEVVAGVTVAGGVVVAAGEVVGREVVMSGVRVGS